MGGEGLNWPGKMRQKGGIAWTAEPNGGPSADLKEWNEVFPMFIGPSFPAPGRTGDETDSVRIGRYGGMQQVGKRWCCIGRVWGSPDPGEFRTGFVRADGCEMSGERWNPAIVGGEIALEGEDACGGGQVENGQGTDVAARIDTVGALCEGAQSRSGLQEILDRARVFFVRIGVCVGGGDGDKAEFRMGCE